MVNIWLNGNFKMILQICLVWVFLVKPSIGTDDTELVQVQIIFRHGDRTPVQVYPNDPNIEAVWQKYGGLGQLTQTGMQQNYKYGFIRFLNGDFNVTEMNLLLSTLKASI